MKKLFVEFPYISKSEEETKKCAEKLAEHLLEKGLVNVICLKGLLGSGKTLFAKGFAQKMGIEHFNVKSPTYTYMREYKSSKNGFKLKHFDYYRINEMDEFMIEEVLESIDGKRQFSLIEWPELIQEYLNNYIELEFHVIDNNKRLILLNYYKNGKNQLYEKAYSVLSEARTPFHVIEHCKKVHFVAKKIGLEMLKKGIQLNLNYVVLAALLHDVLRIVDFENIEDLNKKSDDETISIWAKQRSLYKNDSHCEAGAKYLEEKGLKEISDIVRKHKFEALIDYDKFSLEEKIVSYADKRVLHENIVSMQERFQDGKIRYGSKNLDLVMGEKLYRLYDKLENELFERIDINPEDIKD